jgi:hypothetical protein
MHPLFHQEIARSRQADLLNEARLAHLATQARAAEPQPGPREKLSARFPQRRAIRRVLGLAT